MVIVQDAEIAVDEGIDGFIVSNHGTSHSTPSQHRIAMSRKHPGGEYGIYPKSPRTECGSAGYHPISSLLHTRIRDRGPLNSNDCKIGRAHV